MLTSGTEHYQRQQRIIAAGLIAARRARRRGRAEIVKVVTAFQLAAARDGADSIPLMLEEQGIADRPAGRVAVTAVAGVASDGRPLATLFDQARTDYAFDLMVATQLKDAARVAASLGIVARDQIGYVRVLNAPSCSRCAVLAGKWFRWNTGFERHPGCDCYHVPAREASWRGLTQNPSDYFDSLSEAEQDRIFTKAGAQAIRDGADVSQVVNARRGMSTAARGTSGRRMLTTENVAGRDLYVTRTGATRRGQANRQRTGRNMSARLMPESIYEIAGDREEAVRLLKLHGYIL